MNINPTYLEVAFERDSVRNSQKRLKSYIQNVAVDPLEVFYSELNGKFDIVESILEKRIAASIAYWLENKAEPTTAVPSNLMSEITNSTKNDVMLGDFYGEQVKNAMYNIAPILGLAVPDNYEVDLDELEFVLAELEERFELKELEREIEAEEAAANPTFDTFNYRGAGGNGASTHPDADYGVYDDYEDADYSDYQDDDYYADDGDESEADRMKQDKYRAIDFSKVFNNQSSQEEEAVDLSSINDNSGDYAAFADIVENDPTPKREQRPAATVTTQPAATTTQKQERSLVVNNRSGQEVATAEQTQITINTMNLSSENAWQMTYGMMGYQTEYIQGQMLPRWQSNPEAFEKDRRFLYNSFVEIIRNAAGLSTVAGNFMFSDREITIDQLWGYYYADLLQNVGPQLTAARLQAKVNDPWWKRLWQRFISESKRLSPIWILALIIALIFDGLTTYVSLDQTPMEGFMVMVFTGLITALFQIADLLVISYRKKEFEADALTAKYQAQTDVLIQNLAGLDTSSDSYVQLSMQKSQSHADWKAAEDNRKMARRGRYWSARIADINIIVTAYGFAYMFLNAEEPMYAFYQQIDVMRTGAWESLNLWVFLMIGLAITVSFVINTAQRTEIMGWSLRRLKDM